MVNTNKRVIAQGPDALTKLTKGMDTVANMVATTAGPFGRNILVGIRGGSPKPTNDGFNVAKEIFCKDEVEDLGARYIKEVASSIAEESGDGTTTATILAQKMVHSAFEQMGDRNAIGVKNTANPMSLRRSILKEMNVVIDELKKMAKQVETKEQLYNIALTASEDPEIAKIVSDTIWEVGLDGFVSHQQGSNGVITSEVVRGLRIESGFAERFMVNTRNFECILDKPYVLVTDHIIGDVSPDPEHWFMRLCRELISMGEDKIVVIGETFKDDMIGLAANSLKGGFRILCIRAPYMYQKYVLEDLATYTGAHFIEKGKMPLQQVTVRHLGKAGKVVAKKDETAFIDGAGDKDAIQKAIERLKAEKEKEPLPNFKKKIDERIARLGGAIAVINVDAPTGGDRNYKIDKVEDTIAAVRNAWAEGYVEGGGLALKKIADSGVCPTIADALRAPYNKIQSNAPEKFDIDPNTIDPVKVTRLAVEKACSFAATFITLDGGINNEFDKDLDVLLKKNAPVQE